MKSTFEGSGIAFNLASRYYRSLSPSQRDVMDVEDLIQLVALQLHKRRNEYDPKRGKYTTFVHTVAENTFRDLVRAGKRSSRVQEKYAFEDIPQSLACCRPKDELVKKQIARVERFLYLAHPRLRFHVERGLLKGTYSAAQWRALKIQEQFDALANRLRLTPEDFLVYRDALQWQATR